MNIHENYWVILLYKRLPISAKYLAIIYKNTNKYCQVLQLPRQ